MGLRWILKNFLPPVLTGLPCQLGKLFRGKADSAPEWEIARDGWRTENPRIKGWNVESIVETEKAKWTQFVRAVEGAGPLGIAHEALEMSGNDLNAHNALMTFAYVLARAGRSRNRLSILDCGCGLGHHYVFSKALLPEVELDYHGRDLPLICEAARSILPDVTFHDDEDSCFRRRYDLVVAMTSLHYSEDWRTVAEKLAAACKEYLFIARLPVVSDTPSFVVVQRPYAYGYDTEYIGWYLNRDEFLGHLHGLGMGLVREFLNLDQVDVRGAPEHGDYRSFLFRAGAR